MSDTPTTGISMTGASTLPVIAAGYDGSPPLRLPLSGPPSRPGGRAQTRDPQLCLSRDGRSHSDSGPTCDLAP